eukprot:12107430-Alexandrium_andersonii.AAC.1
MCVWGAILAQAPFLSYCRTLLAARVSPASHALPRGERYFVGFAIPSGVFLGVGVAKLIVLQKRLEVLAVGA